MGNFAPAWAVYVSPVISLLRPKSATFTKWFSPTRQFLAARSLKTRTKKKAMSSLYHLTSGDSKETYCSQRNLGLRIIILIRVLHRNDVVILIHVREKVIFHSSFVRLSSKLFFFFNLK